MRLVRTRVRRVRWRASLPGWRVKGKRKETKRERLNKTREKERGREKKGGIKKKERRILIEEGYRCFDTSLSDVHRCHVTVSRVPWLASGISFLTFHGPSLCCHSCSWFPRRRRTRKKRMTAWKNKKKTRKKVDPSLMPRRTGHGWNFKQRHLVELGISALFCSIRP